MCTNDKDKENDKSAVDMCSSRLLKGTPPFNSIDGGNSLIHSALQTESQTNSSVRWNLWLLLLLESSVKGEGRVYFSFLIASETVNGVGLKCW